MFNCAHLVGFLDLGSKLAIPGGLKQNFSIQLQRREGSCELTGSSSGLNSFRSSLDFHQDSQEVFGKQCKE